MEYLEEDKLNSKQLITKFVEYEPITILNSGYVSLKKEGVSFSGVKMATIATYNSITPASSVSVYAGNSNAYIFGAPNTTAQGLKVCFWY